MKPDVDQKSATRRAHVPPYTKKPPQENELTIAEIELRISSWFKLTEIILAYTCTNHEHIFKNVTGTVDHCTKNMQQQFLFCRSNLVHSRNGIQDHVLLKRVVHIVHKDLTVCVTSATNPPHGNLTTTSTASVGFLSLNQYSLKD